MGGEKSEDFQKYKKGEIAGGGGGLAYIIAIAMYKRTAIIKRWGMRGGEAERRGVEMSVSVTTDDLMSARANGPAPREATYAGIFSIYKGGN